MPRTSKKSKRSNERQTPWFGRQNKSRCVKRSSRSKLGTENADRALLPALAPMMGDINRFASERIYSLPLGEGMIRLVTICAGSGSDMVKCKLKETPLSAPEPYNALSYVWGSTNNTNRIMLDSHEYRVTQNLFEILQELRLPDSDNILWVDALCINQSDKAERSVQVLSMVSVYEKAVNVIGWLGLHENDSASTFELLKIIDLSGDIGQDLKTSHLFFEGIDGLTPLLSREYWCRAWIVQERGLARNFQIRCGPDEASYSALCKLSGRIIFPSTMKVISSESNEDASVHRYFQAIFLIQTLEPGFARSGKGITPELYLDHLIGSKCAERHDSVLAFYNLFSVGVQTRIKSYIQSDVYSMPPDEFLIQAMRAMIEVTQNLYILTIRGRQVRPRLEERWQRNMPSWCPYFGTSVKSVSLAHTSNIVIGTTTDTTTDTISFLEDGKTLRVSGIKIGTIARTLSRGSRSNKQVQNLNDQNDIAKEFKYIRKSFEFVLTLIRKAHDEALKMQAFTVMSQTLVLGRDIGRLCELINEIRKIDKNKKSDSSLSYDDLDVPSEHTLNEFKKNTYSRVICSFTVAPHDDLMQTSMLLLSPTQHAKETSYAALLDARSPSFFGRLESTTRSWVEHSFKS